MTPALPERLHGDKSVIVDGDRWDGGDRTTINRPRVRPGSMGGSKSTAG